MNVASEVKVLLITACKPGEGKSTISVNLAMALASEEDSVLLIDADLRRPRAHEYAGVDGAVGLTNVLSGRLISMSRHTGSRGPLWTCCRPGRFHPTRRNC